MELQILECVPNVSEGRNRRVIESLADAIRSRAGVHLADIHMDPDHHRSVFTILGPPPAVEAAALALAAATVHAIDMRTHRGVHPRIGALDVLPFVPIKGLTIAEAVTVAHRAGQALGNRLDLPVFFYGEAALTPERRQLSAIRDGEYEGLEKKLRDPGWRPDAGPVRFNPRTGATAVGARGILVAFNVWLDSDNLDAARAIARAVRESTGGLPGVQAMGVPLARRGIVQVAMNLLDYRTASLPRVFNRVRSEAALRAITIRRSELVGLAPREAFEGATPESVGLSDFIPEKVLETHLPPE
ncbi:MAG: glutamate formimidoyltransferase [Candidatus Rokubacteria bacterium]|nr:glutamate formimidoyltransferase [Candidatus Rokubacteria bacterium]